MRPAGAQSAGDLPLWWLRASKCCAPGSLDGVEGAAPSAPAPKSAMLSWAVLGLVTVAAAGSLIALQVIPVKPNAPSAAPATNSSAAPIEAPDARLPPAAVADIPAPIAPYAADAPITPIAPVAPNAPNTSSSSLEDVVSRAIPAIVSIEAGQGRGSGFFAAPRTVITNRHVVQNNVRLRCGCRTARRCRDGSNRLHRSTTSRSCASTARCLLSPCCRSAPSTRCGQARK